jgi:DNA-binding response OmpR family regulator
LTSGGRAGPPDWSPAVRAVGFARGGGLSDSTTVAIVNTTPDAIEMLRSVLYSAGFVVVSCFTHDIRDGKTDFEAFMRQHRPRVIVYDLAPPYEQNFRLFQHVRSMPVVEGAQFVMTSVNPPNVTRLVGRDERVYEVVDREEDLMKLVRAVKEASRARPTR